MNLFKNKKLVAFIKYSLASKLFILPRSLITEKWAKDFKHQIQKIMAVNNEFIWVMMNNKAKQNNHNLSFVKPNPVKYIDWRCEPVELDSFGMDSLTPVSSEDEMDLEKSPQQFYNNHANAGNPNKFSNKDN